MGIGLGKNYSNIYSLASPGHLIIRLKINYWVESKLNATLGHFHRIFTFSRFIFGFS